MDQINPYTQEHCALCAQLLTEVAKTRELIDRGERCGLDVTQARAENEAQAKTLESIRREFMSHVP